MCVCALVLAHSGMCGKGFIGLKVEKNKCFGKNINHFGTFTSAAQSWGGDAPAPAPAPFFAYQKEKMETNGKKERVSKQKLLKGCHQGQNIIVLAILERLEFFSVFHGPLHFKIHLAGPVSAILSSCF